MMAFRVFLIHLGGPLASERMAFLHDLQEHVMDFRMRLSISSKTQSNTAARNASSDLILSRTAEESYRIRAEPRPSHVHRRVAGFLCPTIFVWLSGYDLRPCNRPTNVFLKLWVEIRVRIDSQRRAASVITR